MVAKRPAAAEAGNALKRASSEKKLEEEEEVVEVMTEEQWHTLSGDEQGKYFGSIGESITG